MIVYIILILTIGALIVQSIRYERAIKRLWKLIEISCEVASGASDIACDNAEEINNNRLDIESLEERVFWLENVD